MLYYNNNFFKIKRDHMKWKHNITYIKIQLQSHVHFHTTSRVVCGDMICISVNVIFQLTNTILQQYL